jgi:hypothetical protein
MLKNFISKFLYFFAGVVDTADKYSLAIISANFWKNSKRSQWDTQRLGGHWFMKKTWSRKSRVRLPLKILTHKDRRNSCVGLCRMVWEFCRRSCGSPIYRDTRINSELVIILGHREYLKTRDIMYRDTRVQVHNSSLMHRRNTPGAY